MKRVFQGNVPGTLAQHQVYGHSRYDGENRPMFHHYISLLTSSLHGTHSIWLPAGKTRWQPILHVTDTNMWSKQRIAKYGLTLLVTVGSMYFGSSCTSIIRSAFNVRIRCIRRRMYLAAVKFYKRKKKKSKTLMSRTHSHRLQHGFKLFFTY